MFRVWIIIVITITATTIFEITIVFFFLNKYVHTIYVI